MTANRTRRVELSLEMTQEVYRRFLEANDGDDNDPVLLAEKAIAARLETVYPDLAVTLVSVVG